MTTKKWGHKDNKDNKDNKSNLINKEKNTFKKIFSKKNKKHSYT